VSSGGSIAPGAFSVETGAVALTSTNLLKYPKVRIYEGSWTEYSATKLPIAVGPEGSPAQLNSP
jgi:3-mercaptopyruvate sulfurtransferase SseA